VIHKAVDEPVDDAHTEGMPAVHLGALQVACRQCRALAGRPCVDPRGYLAGKPHGRRLLDWRDLERDEAPTTTR
jgi:hypothetical protein